MTVVNNYEPYAQNNEAFTEALIDLKSTIAATTVYPVVGFQAIAFETVSQGEAVYFRSSDGKVGRAVAGDTFDKANVIGFAQTTKLTGELVRILIVGIAPNSGLSPGQIYYLSAVSPGGITTTAPSSSGQYITRVGEAASSTQLIVQLEPPIQLG